MEKVKAGSWVQVKKIVLEPEERKAKLPEDTKKVPLELRVKGFLMEDARVGEEVTVKTYIGREIQGILEDPDPSYEHKFGRPVPELIPVGRELREILKKRGLNK
ncbi:2-amino-4-oxopentanoate thiolase subunit OrtA [Halothermothrix orenii]|uniref:2-amino-4-ketopentanoate thiolase n=1 Tax=Halothermothrix orenii (strain H 168 / OCM 544 / DSM 9562) TaxID=373903 RepID=B8D004_HALOH|nr:2-amino-4-oxopentanoate thiolase subunit OrtA [Halothermothrix orenii]ACL70856.1 hypothetical protein Hore_21110 [Halothermothrix orenii H 168]